MDAEKPQTGFRFERLIEQIQAAKAQARDDTTQQVVDQIRDGLQREYALPALLLSLTKIMSLSRKRSWERAFEDWDEQNGPARIDSLLSEAISDERLVALALADDLGLLDQVSGLLESLRRED